MTRPSRVSGVTIVELLLALAISGLILGALVAFFRLQTQVSGDLQSRNEVEGTLRSVGEVLMQDLQLAGSRAIFNGTNVTYLELRQTPEPADTSSAEWETWRSEQCSGAYRDGCVALDQGSADVTIYYATSLDRGASSACRRIEYMLDEDGVLYRKDVDCDDTSSGFVGYSFASGIDAIVLEFICHNPDTVVDDISICYSATTYPRQATLTITGHAERASQPTSATVTFATSLPNLRPPVDYLDL